MYKWSFWWHLWIFHLTSLPLRYACLSQRVFISPRASITGSVNILFLKLQATVIKTIIWYIHTYICTYVHTYIHTNPYAHPTNCPFSPYFPVLSLHQITLESPELTWQSIWCGLFYLYHFLYDFIICNIFLLFYAYAEPLHPSVARSILASSWKFPQRHYILP